VAETLRVRSFLWPRFWPMWLLFGFLRLVSLLPLSAINAIGKAIGWTMYRLTPSRRRVARINIKQAYPDYSEAQIKQLVKHSFQSVGVSLFELALAWWARRDYLRAHCEVEGLEHLQAALAKNQGVILLTAHFTTLEIGGILMALYTPLNAIYKRAHNPMFNAFMHHYRDRHLNQAIPNKDVRAFINGLRQGLATWYAPDQDFASQSIVFTPFLGGTASTLTSTVRMAEKTGAAIVPFYPVRLADSKGYKLVILPALENFPAGDIMQDATRINRAIDDMVRQNPEQYSWIHKRFKTQPEGAASIY